MVQITSFQDLTQSHTCPTLQEIRIEDATLRWDHQSGWIYEDTRIQSNVPCEMEQNDELSDAVDEYRTKSKTFGRELASFISRFRNTVTRR